MNILLYFVYFDNYSLLSTGKKAQLIMFKYLIVTSDAINYHIPEEMMPIQAE